MWFINIDKRCELKTASADVKISKTSKIIVLTQMDNKDKTQKFVYILQPYPAEM